MAGGRDPRTTLFVSNRRNDQFEQLFEVEYNGYTLFPPSLFPPCFISAPSKNAPSKNAPHYFFVHTFADVA